MKSCFNCGAENGDLERFCHKCGASLVRLNEFGHSSSQAGVGPERVLWEEGDVQLTTEAVLIGMNTDAPDVVPLETIHEVVVEENCLVLRVKYGDDKNCFLNNPAELAALIKDHMMRPRLAHGRRQDHSPAD
jgi:hypothetical protein